MESVASWDMFIGWMVVWHTSNQGAVHKSVKILVSIVAGDGKWITRDVFVGE